MFVMNDLLGQEAVQVSSPHKDSYLHLGAPSSPKKEGELVTKGSILVEAGKDFDLEVATKEPGQLTETVRQGNYKRTVEDTGKLTEDIANKNYLKTIDETGHLAEDMKNRTINVEEKSVETFGEQNITVKGNSMWRFENPSADIFGSVHSETFYGLKNENFIGGKASVFVGSNNEAMFLQSLKLFLALNFEFGAGPTIKATYAPEIGNNFAVKVDKNMTRLTKAVAALTIEDTRLAKSNVSMVMADLNIVL
jgi:hypothetical protein